MSLHPYLTKPLAAIGLLAGLLGPPPAAAVCPGDCNGDGAVAVNELVLGVTIALGTRPLGDCAVFDADASTAVEVFELVSAVGDALAGCPTLPVADSAEALRDSIPEHDETPERQAHQTFVGRLAGTDALIALVADGRFAAGYVCDGDRISEWFLGAETAGQLALAGERGGAIDAARDGGGITGAAVLDGTARSLATVPAVEGQSGLYRTLETVAGTTILSGWIFHDGDWRGADENAAKQIVGTVAADGIDVTTGSGTGVGQPVPQEFDCDQEWCNHENTRCLITNLVEERDKASGKRKKMVVRMIANARDRLFEIGNNLTFEGCAGNGSACDSGYDDAQDDPCCDANGCG